MMQDCEHLCGLTAQPSCSNRQYYFVSYHYLNKNKIECRLAEYLLSRNWEQTADLKTIIGSVSVLLVSPYWVKDDYT
jgi:hypothetical protein